METSHSERLASDLEEVRAVAGLVTGEDDEAYVAGIVELCSANLRKAKQCEEIYVTFDILNEHQRLSAARLGEPFVDFVPPTCGEADTIVADLEHLRGLFASAVRNLKLKEVRRLATLIINSERRLFHTRMESGVYLNGKALEALAESWVGGIDKSDMEAWQARVNSFLSNSPSEVIL